MSHHDQCLQPVQLQRTCCPRWQSQGLAGACAHTQTCLAAAAAVPALALSLAAQRECLCVARSGSMCKHHQHRVSQPTNMQSNKSVVHRTCNADVQLVHHINTPSVGCLHVCRMPLGTLPGVHQLLNLLPVGQPWGDQCPPCAGLLCRGLQPAVKEALNLGSRGRRRCRQGGQGHGVCIQRGQGRWLLLWRQLLHCGRGVGIGRRACDV